MTSNCANPMPTSTLHIILLNSARKTNQSNQSLEGSAILLRSSEENFMLISNVRALMIEHE